MVQRPVCLSLRAFFFVGYHPTMQLSAQLAMWGCAVFALACLGFAADGFLGLTSVIDPVEREAAAGYAWFWAFLGLMVAGCGVLYWLMLTGRLSKVD